jgi:hypothetical protein
MEAGGLISPSTDFSPMSTYLFKYTEKKIVETNIDRNGGDM